MLPLATILAGGQALAGLFSMFSANQVPPELREAYDLLRKQAKEGLPREQELSMLSTGSANIGAQVGAMQNRGAAALASRGASNSSAADSLITSVNKTQAEAFTNLQNSILQADWMAKQSAQDKLAGVAGEIAALKQAKMTSGATALVGGLGNLTNILQPPKNPYEELLKFFELQLGITSGMRDASGAVGTQWGDVVEPQLLG